MKFVRTVLELDIYGEKHALRFPTMAEFTNFAEEATKEGTNEVQLTYRLLEKLGLPQKVCEGLEPNHLSQIVDSLAPKK
jgi:hypothetical protein|tara:strand:+ start:871 stop:1107 length:237 start_codon:yes stop_codon:yes gene_type:complete